MTEKMDKVIKQRLLRKLARYNEMNFQDPAVVTIATSDVIVELAEIQEQYAQFDADLDFDYDPAPYLTISWWLNGISDNAEVIKFRFDPIRVEGDVADDAIAAYNRAMSIL